MVKVNYNARSKKKYGKPLLTYGSGKDILVFWRKDYTVPETETQIQHYFVTKYAPRSRRHTLIAETYANVGKDSAHVNGVYTDERYKRRGIASALNSFAQNDLRGKRLTLRAFDRPERRLYHKLGYRPAKEGYPIMTRRAENKNIKKVFIRK